MVGFIQGLLLQPRTPTLYPRDGGVFPRRATPRLNVGSLRMDAYFRPDAGVEPTAAEEEPGSDALVAATERARERAGDAGVRNVSRGALGEAEMGLAQHVSNPNNPFCADIGQFSAFPEFGLNQVVQGVSVACLPSGARVVNDRNITGLRAFVGEGGAHVPAEPILLRSALAAQNLSRASGRQFFFGVDMASTNLSAISLLWSRTVDSQTLRAVAGALEAAHCNDENYIQRLSPEDQANARISDGTCSAIVDEIRASAADRGPDQGLSLLSLVSIAVSIGSALYYGLEGIPYSFSYYGHLAQEIAHQGDQARTLGQGLTAQEIRGRAVAALAERGLIPPRTYILQRVLEDVRSFWSGESRGGRFRRVAEHIRSGLEARRAAAVSAPVDAGVAVSTDAGVDASSDHDDHQDSGDGPNDGPPPAAGAGGSGVESGNVSYVSLVGSSLPADWADEPAVPAAERPETEMDAGVAEAAPEPVSGRLDGSYCPDRPHGLCSLGDRLAPWQVRPSESLRLFHGLPVNWGVIDLLGALGRAASRAGVEILVTLPSRI